MEPQPNPPPATTTSETLPQPPERPRVSAGVIVLQWLTYAFWGWTVLALSALTTLVVATFITGANPGEVTPYGIAAVLVLLPISFLCDHFYSKKEPDSKSGVEVLVMVIHAVIFALFGIGSLIFAVFAMVQLLISSTEVSQTITGLVSALIISLYYGLTFLRTLKPQFVPWIGGFYRLFMVVTVGIFVALGFIGPVARQIETRDDRLISENISSLSNAVNAYARTNDKLPQSLDDVTVKDDAKQLVERDLVEYKPKGEETLKRPPTNTTITIIDNNNYNSFRYELCVEYKKESGNNDYYDSRDTIDGNDDYQTYISAYSHPAGEVCYKLKTSSY